MIKTPNSEEATAFQWVKDGNIAKNGQIGNS